MFQKSRRSILALFMAVLLLAALPFGNLFMAEAAGNTSFSVQLQIGSKKVSKKTYQMTAGVEKKLKVKASTKANSIQYRSSNKKVASVSKNGVIRAKKDGTAKITATVKTTLGSRSTWMKVRVRAAAQPDQVPEPDQIPGSDQIPAQPDALPEENGEKILIAYFTRSGNAEKIADVIAEKTGGTAFRIETEKTYPEDYQAVLEEASREREQNERPALKSRVQNMAEYSTVFVGYPIWFGDIPMAVHTFLESYDFTGKKVIPFCTSGSSSPKTSFASVRVSAAGAEILDGFWTRGANADNAKDEVSQWIDGLGIMGGNQGEDSGEGKIKITAGNHVFYADLADNSSAAALREMLSNGPVTINMSDYGNMEKVGSLGRNLPRNDENITTGPGDLILYQGNSLVIYYDTNTWNFTRLGKIEGVTRQELLAAFGKGDVTVTFSL